MTAIRRKHQSDRAPVGHSGIEWFTGTRSSLSNNTISIARDGSLRYNAGFLHAHKLRAYTGVELGYDPERKRIASRFRQYEKAGPSLKLKDHAGGKVARARSLFNQYGLDAKRLAARYLAKPIRAHGRGPIFIIDLEPQKKRSSS